MLTKCKIWGALLSKSGRTTTKMSQYGIAVNWGGPGRGTTAPATGRKALPANPLAALCLPASQNASLWDPRWPLASAEEGGPWRVPVAAPWRARREVLVRDQRSQLHLTGFNHIIEVYEVAQVWNNFQICNTSLGMNRRLGVLGVIQPYH